MVQLRQVVRGVTTLKKYLPRDDHHVRLPAHCCDVATGAGVRGRQRLEVLLLSESYATLIPENEDVLVGMRASKTMRMRRSCSRQHVTRVTLIGAHPMLMMMYRSKRVHWLVVAVVVLYDLVDYLVTRRGVQQAMQVDADKCSSEVREEGTMQANAFAASVLTSFADKRGGKVEE
jgi:hypothetical protein